MVSLRAPEPATRTSPALPARENRHRKAFWRFWPQYLAISPFYLIFLVFGAFPVGFSLYLSFHRWAGLGAKKFIGLDQYRFLLQDKVFWHSLTNTLLIWIISTVPMIAMALVLASLMHFVLRAKTFYRLALFIPNVTSVVAMAIFFSAVFGTQFGLVNASLRVLHLPMVDWLRNAWGIKITIASLMTWQWTGYNAIIYLAGLQTIPRELYEAAQIDGANWFKTFFRITLPLLRPIILFTVIVSTISGLQSFTEPQVILPGGGAQNPDAGGQGQAGLTMVLYFYQQAFDFNDYGYGAAISWMIFLIVGVFAVINWRLVARKED